MIVYMVRQYLHPDEPFYVRGIFSTMALAKDAIRHLIRAESDAPDEIDFGRTPNGYVTSSHDFIYSIDIVAIDEVLGYLNYPKRSE